MQHISSKFKLFIIGIYMPPFKRKDIDENNIRIQKITKYTEIYPH